MQINILDLNRPGLMNRLHQCTALYDFTFFSVFRLLSFWDILALPKGGEDAQTIRNHLFRALFARRRNEGRPSFPRSLQSTPPIKTRLMRVLAPWFWALVVLGD